ncbi:MAG: NADH-quinone oxidoreductase subunit A [Myxococcales bacterium]|nr:NADH-quinone oxidoreductase subunit A [Myxococcales bacterium]USN50870.1 MAG: NADH-quinone oxidoreductase subunit A [Myxococcales bacterium]
MSLAIYCFGVITVVLVMLSSYFLGERSTNPRKRTPYEGGIKSAGTARVHFFAQYFLVAILFVVFDLESAFIYLWATSVVDVGWLGFIEISVFISMLLLSLYYVIAKGVLRFGPRPRVAGGARS